MDTIERNVALILNGSDAEESQDYCDFTLDDLNEACGNISFVILYIQEISWQYVTKTAVFQLDTSTASISCSNSGVLLSWGMFQGSLSYREDFFFSSAADLVLGKH